MNAEQHEALYNLFRAEVITETPFNDAEQLIYDFMIDISKKLRSKQEARLPKDWSLTLSDKETLAYKIYWELKIIPVHLVYETNIINRQLAEIDQQISYHSKLKAKQLGNNKSLNA